MKKNRLGKTSHQVSQIGLGTVQFGLDYGFTKVKTQEEVDEILDCANTNGVNLIDTAREYGDSEAKIGNYISQNANAFIVATKLQKMPYESSLSYNALKDTVYASIEKSLLNLKVEKISLLQLHQTDDYLTKNDVFWEVIKNLKNEKLIDGFGVSIYDENEMALLIEKQNEIIDFFQVPYNIFDRRFTALEKKLIDHSIGIISRSTFLKGIITCSLNDLPEQLNGLAMYKTKLNDLSNKLSMGIDELALLFVIHNQLIASTILGVNSSKELFNNINILNNAPDFFEYDVFKDLCVNNLHLIDPRKWAQF